MLLSKTGDRAAREVFQIYQDWSPDLIPFCPPLMVLLILGPNAVILRYALGCRIRQNEEDDLVPSIEEELLILILGIFARYWNIGSFLLGMSAPYLFFR